MAVEPENIWLDCAESIISALERKPCFCCAREVMMATLWLNVGQFPSHPQTAREDHLLLRAPHAFLTHI